MTKQEYDEIMKNLDSDDPALKIQALFVKGLYPSWPCDNKYTMKEVEDKLREILGGNLG